MGGVAKAIDPGPTGPNRPLAAARRLTRHASWALPVGVILVLIAPMALTHRAFGIDWVGHLWVLNAQTHNFLELGRPSYFIQSSVGAFYPWFAFYGGTLYSVVGGLAALAGGRVTPVYVLSYAAAMALAQVGMTWLARQAGLRGWVSHLPGIAFITSAYYVTDVYARGAWPETVAISALPLVLAAGLSLVRARRPRPGPAAAFLGGVAIVAGSHNITLALASLFLAAVGVTAVVAAGRRRSAVGRRVGLLAALFGLGVGMNLWFLVIAFAHRHDIPISVNLPRPSTPQLTLGVFTSPYRFSAFEPLHTTFDLQAPTVLLVWSVAALWLTSPLARVPRAVARGLGVILALLSVLILVGPAWSAVPRGLWFIQFPYRLETYVVLCVVGLMVISLASLATAPPRLRHGLVAVLAVILTIETTQAVVQAWRTHSFIPDRRAITGLPPTQAPPWWVPFSSPNEFADLSAPVVRPTLATIPGVTVQGLPARAADGRPSETLSLPVVERIRRSYDLYFPLAHRGSVVTNVLAGPYLVTVRGGRPVGRTPDSRMVVEIDPPARGANAHVGFSTAHSPIVIAGLAGSIASLLASAGLLGFLWRRRR